MCSHYCRYPCYVNYAHGQEKRTINNTWASPDASLGICLVFLSLHMQLGFPLNLTFKTNAILAQKCKLNYEHENRIIIIFLLPLGHNIPTLTALRTASSQFECIINGVGRTSIGKHLKARDTLHQWICTHFSRCTPSRFKRRIIWLSTAFTIVLKRLRCIRNCLRKYFYGYVALLSYLKKTQVSIAHSSFIPMSVFPLLSQFHFFPLIFGFFYKYQ